LWIIKQLKRANKSPKLLISLFKFKKKSTFAQNLKTQNKMATNRTFTMIKPDAVANGHIGNILAMITNAGFKIISLKLTQLTVADAQAFYSVHAARPTEN
jgi:nucleoside-diphosphate kinase